MKPRLRAAIAPVLLGASVAQHTSAAATAEACHCVTIRVIVPYAPGGGSDVVARLVAGKLAEQEHTTVIVDNRPGGKSVPYRGSVPALNDLLSGQIQALFVDGLAARPLINAGKTHAIAAVGSGRWKAFPNLPTFGDL